VDVVRQVDYFQRVYSGAKICARECASVYVYVLLCMYVYVRAVCMYMRAVWVRTCLLRAVYVCVCVCICVCCVCMHVCVLCVTE
jgi:hypothetical protein